MEKLNSVGYSIDKVLINNIAVSHINSLIDVNEYAKALSTMNKYANLGIDCTELDNKIYNSFESHLSEIYYSKGKDYLSATGTAFEKYSKHELSQLDKVYVALSDMKSNNGKEADLNLVMNNLDVADAKELIMNYYRYAKKFLVGDWRGDGYFLTMLGDYSITYNLPCYDVHGSYDIGKGGRLKIGNKDQFVISILSKNTISVYCYKDGNSYILTRH